MGGHQIFSHYPSLTLSKSKKTLLIMVMSPITLEIDQDYILLPNPVMKTWVGHTPGDVVLVVNALSNLKTNENNH